jgi:FAD/FMN-containing dehydrogenase/Fe-S oxidoreductase
MASDLENTGSIDQPAADLQRDVQGDVQFDAVSRALYATDASIYQIEPLGVVTPRDAQDVQATLRIARQYSVPITSRGGGTSLAGQAVGQTIHLDFTKYMRRVLEVNVEEGWAWVEPGIVLDDLNAALAPHGLKFAPDVSPSNRATVGGMIANNSSGMYSLLYGKTLDHVLELKVALSDGSVTTLGPLTDEDLRQKLMLDSLEGRAYRTVRRLSREHADEIARRFPKVLRRVGGYNLDSFVGQESGVRSPTTNDKRQTTNDERRTATDHRRPTTDESLLLSEAKGRTTNDERPRTETHHHRVTVSSCHRVNKVDSRFNLSHIIVGSEGTLAIMLAAKIRLVPRPKQTAIAVVEFDTLDDALAAVVPCLECHPAAVELMDDILLDQARKSPTYGRYLSFLKGKPQAMLQVEFFGATPGEIEAQLERLEQRLRGIVGLQGISRALTAEEKGPILQVRKASMPLLQSISPDLRPETFVEDSAVPPEKLGAYVRRFREIVHSHGVRVTFYGHASVGVMHARPLLNLKDAQDIAKMRAIAEAIKDLVLEFGGALSGEHGDGLLRSEFNRELFGETLYEAFREVKRTFDPKGLLNPGKIVDAQPMDANLRYGPLYHTIPLRTHFRFRDSGGFAGAAELCNGNGLCRKTASGTMCPSYMVTRDEEHSTRGRANALRMALSGALPLSELTGERMREVMDLCIECKGCAGECPSRVDMTRIKSEWLSQYHAVHGVPLRALLFGHIHCINQIGSVGAPLLNRLFKLPGVAFLNQKLLGISRRRSLPQFAREPFHRWFERRSREIRDWRLEIRRSGAQFPISNLQSPMPVVLFPDTFTNYNEPEVGKAAVRLLEAAGYEVLLPRRRVCCGRSLISKGLLGDVKRLAREQMEWLAPYAEAGLPIVGLEPSCILTFRDEYPDLLDDPRAETLARQSFLIDEFLAREVAAGRAALPFRQGDERGTTNDESNTVLEQSATPIDNTRSSSVSRPLSKKRGYLLHGHCHQKALVGTADALALLRLIPGADVREVDSGCCGMAGSFGYEAEHYALSQAIGERALFPAVRALPPDTTIVAMGTSCRHQIVDATGRRARHLVEALAEELA